MIIPSLVDVDRAYLKLCVESIRSSVDWDIIAVLNGTKSHNPLHDTPIKGITKTYITKQQGQCNAVNRGAEGAEGDCKWLFVSNADMFYHPNWTKNLPDLDDPEIPLCFSPNLCEPSDNRGSAPPFLKYNGGLDLDSFKRQAVEKNLEAREKQEKDKWEDGFNLPFFIRKDVWQTSGGYDEAYDPWGSNSDTDLQMKIELAGIKPQRLRKLLVYHFSEKSGTFDRDNTEKDQAWWDNWHHLENVWGFNRDEAGSDTWYCKDMIMQDKLKFHPAWENKYV
jgi:GT2 family glycosyltransferase